MLNIKNYSSFNSRIKDEYLNAVDSFKAFYPTFNFPEVSLEWNSRMRTTAGRAFCVKKAIHLNYTLLIKNPQEVIPTFIHELAHIYAHILYPSGSSHGKEWRRVHCALGMEPERTHSMNVGDLKRRQTRIDYFCDCKIHKITTRRHNMISKGERYVCRLCKSILRRSND